MSKDGDRISTSREPEPAVLKHATREEIGFDPSAPYLGRADIEELARDRNEGIVLWEMMPGGLVVYLEPARRIAQHWKPRTFAREVLYVRCRPEAKTSTESELRGD